MKLATVSIKAFAFKLSTLSIKLREASQPFATCYATADDAGRKQLRNDWMIGHINGYTGDEAATLELLGKSRTDRSKDDQNAYSRAASDFNYHVVRDSKSANKSDDVEIPANILAAAKALARLCNEYEGARSLANKAVAKAFAG